MVTKTRVFEIMKNNITVVTPPRVMEGETNTLQSHVLPLHASHSLTFSILQSESYVSEHWRVHYLFEFLKDISLHCKSSS